MTRTRTPAAIQIATFETALLIHEIHLSLALVLEEHVVNQIQGAEQRRLLVDGQILLEFDGKYVGVGGEFGRELLEIGRFLLHYPSYLVSGRVLHDEGVVAAQAGDAAKCG